MSYEFYKGLIQGKLEILNGLTQSLSQQLASLRVDFDEMCEELEREPEAPEDSSIEETEADPDSTEKKTPTKRNKHKNQESEPRQLVIPDYSQVKTISEAISLLSENNEVSEKQLRIHILMSVSTWDKVMDGQAVYESTRRKFVENFGIPEQLIPTKTALSNLKRPVKEAAPQKEDWIQERQRLNNLNLPSQQ